MFKILFVFFCIVSNMFSETFGIDVPVEGIWRIDTAKKGESIEVANMVGFNVALKFEKDGSVRKLNYQTLAPLSLSPGNSHIWELKNKGIIHITVKNPNGNFITDYMLITPPINNLNYVIILDGKNRRKKIITKRVV